MKVLLVYPILDCPPGINHGLAAISGVLRARGHEPRLVHLSEHLPPVPAVEEVLEIVREWNPGLVGLSVMTQQYKWARNFARELKKAFPALPVAIGGVHCTMVPEEVERHGLEEPLWDYIFVGEGEWPFAELCDRLERGDPTDRIPNTRILRDGKVVRNPVGPFPDLAELPPKDYGLFDLPRITEAKKGWFSLLTSRGCPYQCTYCFNREIVNRYLEEGGIRRRKEYLRRYPIPRIIGELLELKDRVPGMEVVIFDDDLFTLDKAYVLEFCRAYAAAGVELPFVVNAHVQSFDLEMARALKEAGCIIVKFGLESGSPRVRREILARPMTNETIAAGFRAAHEAGIHSSAFIMIGLPTETREEIMETLELCARIGIGRFRWAVFYPFPGTKAFAISRDLDLIDWDKWENMGNYFDASCLKFGPEHDLFLEKLTLLCHWWVNALTAWPSAPLYAEKVREVEAMDRDTFRARKEELTALDREISEDLLARRVPHYSLRFSKVMGVHSDYILWERAGRAGGSAPAGAEYTLE